MRMTLLAFAVLALAACRADAPSPTSADAEAGTAPEAATPAPEAAPPLDADANDGAAAPDDDTDASGPAAVLAGKVWRVERRSDGGEVGATYAFLADGTLVVDSPNGTPTAGRWAVDGGALSLSEEGIAYPTDLVPGDADHVTLRSHNPGGVVEIALVRARDVPLPGGG